MKDLNPIIPPEDADPWDKGPEEDAWKDAYAKANPGVNKKDITIYPVNEAALHNEDGATKDTIVNIKIGVGNEEYVYNMETGEVVSGQYAGTFNFLAPGNPLSTVVHGVYDVAPWILFGTGFEGDKSTIGERTGSAGTGLINLITGAGNE